MTSTDPQLTSAIYDSITEFQQTAQYSSLQHAQMRQYLAEHLAGTVGAEVRRLSARVWELERPAVEAKRNEIRQSFTELIAAAEETKDYEGAFDVQCRLREREEQWAREDAAAPAVRSDAD
ncbi:hypothetical protein [Streptomyces naphthomycinicus]|uniref:hypothetical protein n=1 Tax=Streptomyces naphthomycinicus TaxID=2872625 RepID=UPI001CED91B3|nr:hypothetical protein [Streptomyces sp. TML10]